MKHISIVFLIIVALLSACTKNKHDVDISSVEVDLKVFRFDEDLFKESNDWKSRSIELRNKYGAFYKNLTQMIPNLGNPEDPAHFKYLERFATDKDMLDLQATIEETFPDVDPYVGDLSTAFSYYRYHFPKKVIPEIIFFNSALNASPLVNDGQMGIGLDLFLGADFERYGLVSYPQYISRRMTPDHMVTNSVRGWLISEFPKDNSENLLDDIIWEGKILYAMDALFPFTHDSLKIEYRGQDLDWCRAFEANIWAFMIDKELLFETNKAERLKLLNDGPFTSGFAKESPSRVGKWLGWQIIRAYMENNELGLEAMFAEKDSQKILQLSKYKPGK